MNSNLNMKVPAPASPLNHNQALMAERRHQPAGSGYHPQPVVTDGQLPPGVHIATREAELSSIYRLRYAVYVEELGKTVAAADHRTRRLTDVHDETAVQLYLEAGGEIAGCMRMHVGYIPALLAEPLDLPRFTDFQGADLCFVSKLMVRKDHRKSTVAARLMSAGFAIARMNAVKAAFCTTFPHLVPLYERIGFESYNPMYTDPELGPHFALVLFLDRLAGLKKTSSVLLNMMSPVLDRPGSPKQDFR